jgi:hypothetical protein
MKYIIREERILLIQLWHKSSFDFYLLGLVIYFHINSHIFKDDLNLRETGCEILPAPSIESRFDYSATMGHRNDMSRLEL